MNRSRVELEVRQANFRIQHIAPATDQEVEALYAQVFTHKTYKEVQWETLDEDRRTWNKNEFLIEPSEAHSETVEFFVSTDDVETVLIDSYIHNSRFVPGSRSAPGWGCTTVYDIVKRS